MKITVYSITVNTLFIELQIKSFAKFLSPHEVNFIVINNGISDEQATIIDNHCKERGIICYRPEHGRFDSAGISHQLSLNWACKNLILKHEDDMVILTDFDIFPFKPININETYTLFSGVKQGDDYVNYLWPGLVFMRSDYLRKNKLYEKIDFRGAMISHKTNSSYICDPNEGFTWEEYWKKIAEGFKPFDSGAMLYFTIRDLEFKELSLDLDIKDRLPESIAHLHDPDFKFWVIEDSWLHFGRGSNWDNKNELYFNNKVSFLNCWMNEVL